MVFGEENAKWTLGGKMMFYESSREGRKSLANQGSIENDIYGDFFLIKKLMINMEVLTGGPLDKAINKIETGDIITAINSKEIQAAENWNKDLLNLEGENIMLTVKSGSRTFSDTLKHISMGEEYSLMYRRWVETMEQKVDSLSNGELGYLHIRGMNDRSFRDVYEQALGKNINKKALVVDTRFNGGGWLHDDLNTFLSGEEYLKFTVQGDEVKEGEPVTRWTKPSIVIMSEGNYSDAYIFPYIYKQNGIGKLVGMPVAGTGSALWWEQQIGPTIVFGIPHDRHHR